MCQQFYFNVIKTHLNCILKINLFPDVCRFGKGKQYEIIIVRLLSDNIRPGFKFILMRKLGR